MLICICAASRVKTTEVRSDRKNEWSFAFFWQTRDISQIASPLLSYRIILLLSSAVFRCWYQISIGHSILNSVSFTLNSALEFYPRSPGFCPRPQLIRHSRVLSVKMLVALSVNKSRDETGPFEKRRVKDKGNFRQRWPVNSVSRVVASGDESPKK